MAFYYKKGNGLYCLNEELNLESEEYSGYEQITEQEFNDTQAKMEQERKERRRQRLANK